jgi:hypothetical protein
MIKIQVFQQTINIVAVDKVKSHSKHPEPDFFGGNGRQMLSYCHRENYTVEISTPADLPYTLEVPNHYQGSPIHSSLYREVHHLSYCVQTQDLLMLKVHIYIYIYIYLTNSVFLFA